MIKIIAEASVPFLRGVAEQYADIEYIDNKDITSERIRTADALIVRSITKCTADLLDGSSVRFIATATAGTDHIDADYCAAHNIAWTNAPGCNAMGVAQYVCSCLSLLSLRHGIELSGKKIGIIGVGHVGQLVTEIALALGMQPLLNDPPRLEQEGDNIKYHEYFTSLETIQKEADIITLHVPLSKTGAYPTLGMVNDSFLSSCKKGLILINACRGGVCRTESLIKGKKDGTIAHLVLDCWEGEPHINAHLLEQTDIASPHIAGFSADGKHRGARMALLSISDFFGLGASQDLLIPKELEQPQAPIALEQFPPHEAVLHAQLTSFNPEYIDQALRADISQFEFLRKHYNYPREMSAYTIEGGTEEDRRTLSRLGFQCKLETIA